MLGVKRLTSSIGQIGEHRSFTPSRVKKDSASKMFIAAQAANAGRYLTTE
jgi:hypothetical protein